MLIGIDVQEAKVTYFTLLSYRHVGALEILRLQCVFIRKTGLSNFVLHLNAANFEIHSLRKRPMVTTCITFSEI